MRLIGTICCAWFLISTCNAQEKADEQSDLKVYSDFSDHEVEVIQKFLIYLDSTVSVFRINSSSLNIYARDSSTYHESDLNQIINQLLMSENLEHLRIAITILKSEKLINDFWKVREVRNPFEKTIGSELKINTEGRYFRMVQQLADIDELVSEYYNLSLPVGELSPGMVALLFKSDTRNINFHSESMRLMWIIHYITLITQMNDGVVESLQVN